MYQLLTQIFRSSRLSGFQGVHFLDGVTPPFLNGNMNGVTLLTLPTISFIYPIRNVAKIKYNPII